MNTKLYLTRESHFLKDLEDNEVNLSIDSKRIEEVLCH